MFRASRFILFVVVFLIPFLAITVYTIRFATDRFDSVSSIIVTEERGAASTLDLSALGLPSPIGVRDPLVIAEFIRSVDMLQYLDKKLDLRAHYSAPGIDWWNRLPAGYSLEDFHGYVLDFLKVTLDTDSQMIKIQVQTFNREY